MAWNLSFLFVGTGLIFAVSKSSPSLARSMAARFRSCAAALVVATLSVLTSVEGNAATIEFRKTESSSTPRLVLSGEIVEGDLKRLVQLLADPKSIGTFSLGLNSPGGSVNEAVRIAKLVQALYISVHVLPDSVCASACFFVYLAGSGKLASASRLMDPQAREERSQSDKRSGLLNLPTPGFVGLHRPFIRKISSLSNSQATVMRLVSGYLEGQMLSRRLIDLMMSQPSNDITG